MDDAWAKWSSDVNGRLGRIERWVYASDDESRRNLLNITAEVVKEFVHQEIGRARDAIRAEIATEANSIRGEVGLPLQKARVRVKAGSAPWP